MYILLYDFMSGRDAHTNNIPPIWLILLSSLYIEHRNKTTSLTYSYITSFEKHPCHKKTLPVIRLDPGLLNTVIHNCDLSTFTIHVNDWNAQRYWKSYKKNTLEFNRNFLEFQIKIDRRKDI